MSASRVLNTKKNIIWSYIDYAVTLAFQFVTRVIIIQTLGKEYLGLSSLYSSILSVLSMAELGFSTAIIFNLYKPIADNDVDTVCALLAFYKKIYRIVGIIILIIGALIVPFLPNLIKGDYPTDISIYGLYCLYLLNAGISYFMFAYKTALLNALQRMDLIKIAYSIINISQCIFQIVVLVLFRNYYLFVVGTIIGNVARNLLAAYFAKRKFPQYTCKGEVSKSLKAEIWKRVKGLLVSKISSVTYTTFDNIILSSMRGLVSVAIYSNYLNIYNSIGKIIVLMRQAMQSSIGNSIAIESKEKNYKDVFTLQFLFSIIAIWCAVFLLCLYQPFMKLWMGEDMLLSMVDVVLLCILLAVSTVQHSFYLYLSGDGLWWEMRWPYICSTVANLIMNVVFCRWWKTTGIILATVIANTVFGLIWQSSIVFRNYFEKSNAAYMKKQLLFFVIGTIIGFISYSLCSIITLEGIAELAYNALICAVVPPACMYLIFRKTPEFIRSKQYFRQVIHK